MGFGFLKQNSKAPFLVHFCDIIHNQKNKRMSIESKILALIFKLMWCLLPFISNSQTIPSEAAFNNLHRYYDLLTEQQKFQGVVLVAKGQQSLFHKAYGLADINSNIPNTIQHGFRIGSITKSFTSILIAQAIESEKLSLNTTVDTYIADFPRGQDIQLRHLLSHTSGIVNYFALPDFDNTRSYQPLELVDYVKELPLQFEPGDGWDYSNTNYAILGYMLETIYQKPFGAILDDQIFQPLGMIHSGIIDDELSLLATGHGINQEGDLEPIELVHQSASYAAGNIISTSEDMLRFSNAIKSLQLVGSETLEAFTTPIRNGYGLGFISHHNHQNRYYGHNGGNNGFHANWKYFPDLDLTAIILCNNFMAPFGQIVSTTASILFDQPYEIPTSFKEIVLPAEVMKSYEGNFYVTEEMTFHLNLSEEGYLYFQATGQDAFRVLPYQKDGFFLKNTDVSIEFIRNDKNEIIQLIWKQGGRSDRFEKILNSSEN